MTSLERRRETFATRGIGCSQIALLLSLALSGCADLGDAAKPYSLLSSLNGSETKTGPDTRSELEKATEYWGKEYSKNPRDLDAAINYAKNLRAGGQKAQAMDVLQQASVFHSTERRLASEYGRLALELDQVSVATQMLAAADDPANPDWRIISARGTALAKQGKYRDAIPFFDKALTLAPNQPSVLNNLALAHTMNGDATKAEEILRKIADKDGANPKSRQNLALVLGLQGKYDEAKQVGSRDLAPDQAAANTDYLKKIVRLEGKPMPGTGVILAKAVPGPSLPPVQPMFKPAAVETAAAGSENWATSVASVQPSKVGVAPAFKPSAAP